MPAFRHVCRGLAERPGHHGAPSRRARQMVPVRVRSLGMRELASERQPLDHMCLRIPEFRGRSLDLTPGQKLCSANSFVSRRAQLRRAPGVAALRNVAWLQYFHPLEQGGGARARCFGMPCSTRLWVLFWRSGTGSRGWASTSLPAWSSRMGRHPEVGKMRRVGNISWLHR